MAHSSFSLVSPFVDASTPNVRSDLKDCRSPQANSHSSWRNIAKMPKKGTHALSIIPYLGLLLRVELLTNTYSKEPDHPGAPPLHGPNRLLLHLHAPQDILTHEHAQIRPNRCDRTALLLQRFLSDMRISTNARLSPEESPLFRAEEEGKSLSRPVEAAIERVPFDPGVIISYRWLCFVPL